VAYWRLKLDVPISQAIETGLIFSRYAKDFKSTKGGLVNTWACPHTGVVMLLPSVHTRDFGDDFKELGTFRIGDSAINFWRETRKSAQNLAMFTNRKPSASEPTDIELVVAAALQKIEENEAEQDDLTWALESKFTLGVDEGFCIHYMGLTDELLRKNNWFYVQWDNVGIHVSQSGRVRVYKYADRGNLNAAPEIVDDFEIAEPGDFLQKHGRFFFLPIPGYGLMMYHLEQTSKSSWYLSNSKQYTIGGSHLIPWTARKVGSHYRLFETSMVRIALNPYFQNIIGYQKVTFPASGTFLDEVFDPGYKPSADPVDATVQYLQSFSGNFATVSGTLKNGANSDVWTAGTDRKARAQFNLATSDERYTPFVYGFGVQWAPVTLTRDTTPLTITTGYQDVLQRLEFTEDSEGHFEGSAVMKLQSAAGQAIAERGDCTFTIEYSLNNTDWTVVNGGYGKFGKLKMMYHPDWGHYWDAPLYLHGMEERFEELYHRTGTAFDGMTILEAINLVLYTHGFAAIAEADAPGPAVLRRFPLSESGDFKFAPRPGDSGRAILRDCLLFLRHQYLEYKLKWNWADQQWELLQRERNPSAAWTLTVDTENFGSSIARYKTFEIEPQPPEANLIIVQSAVKKDNKEPVLIQSQPLKNYESVTNSASVDYLGRTKEVVIPADGLTTVAEADRLARTVFPRISHRNLTGKIEMPEGHANLNLYPDRQVIVEIPGKSDITLWIKAMTIVIDASFHGPTPGVANEMQTLFVDEIWENEIRGGR
jgi:hypothetical protein